MVEALSRQVRCFSVNLSVPSSVAGVQLSSKAAALVSADDVRGGEWKLDDNEYKKEKKSAK